MRRIASIIFALLPLSVFCPAQNKNLNPTVHVTNAYQAQFIEAQKPAALVTVPDSLYKFDLDFDYNGFEKPYRGSTDFNPFLTELEFARKSYYSKRLVMKAGAGYVLSPELDLVWGIKQKGRFKAGAFASHDSYFGKYSSMASAGLDARSRAGVDLRYDWSKANLILLASCDHAMGKDSNADCLRQFGGLSASVELNSNLDPALSQIRYRLMASYAYGADSYQGSTLEEHVVDADGYIDLVFGKHLVGIDADFDMASSALYGGGSAVVRPRYIFSTGALTVEAGVAAALCKVSGKATKDHAFDIFPSVDLLFKLVPQKMEFFARADMSSKLFSNREAALETRFFVADTLKAVTKEFFADLGFKGRFADTFSYSLGGGIHRSTNPALYDFSKAGVSFTHVSKLDYFAASCTMDLKAGPARLGGNFEWRAYMNVDALRIVPPQIRADVYASLKLRNRWNFSVTADYRSYWRCDDSYADDFVNLSSEIRYNFTSRFAVYLKGTNLLGHSLQYVPGYGRRELSVLGGIVLTI